ncbi:MAG: thiamine-phosphate kinase [Cyanobacteria bacterium SID2]|nr:thiamine-phosphate kinase [Cyanobacteria bacterium SID2]MBP0005917.1 thiamine-phosphate kinase [Cyanobacteria bacterium SBC]
MRVCDIGERGLLERLHRFCPTGVVGDDAAVLSFPTFHQLVVTTDTLVDGVHFSPATTNAEDAGWRAVAANLSDLASMGAFPIGITVSLGLPGETPVQWVEGLYRGMKDCLDRFETTIVGGDLCKSPVVSVSITAFGRVKPDSIIRRSQAKPGDSIVVTGVHGASRGGLELLLNPETGQTLSPQQRDRLIRAHQRPMPRVDAIAALWEACDGEMRVAGMDSSDGLADAAVQISRESGVAAQLWLERLPIASELSAMVSQETARQWTLYGGEDFELVLCLPPESARRFVSQVAGASVVGEIVDGEGAWLVDGDAREPLTMQGGFQHFKGEA